MELQKQKARFELAAGGIVFRRRGRGAEIGFILDPFKKWIFPKGHVEKGEKVEAAAMRETKEEMGIRKLRQIAYLGKIDLWFVDRYRLETKGERIHKPVHYFLFEAPSGAFGKPQRTEKVLAIKWVPAREAPSFCSYRNARVLVHKALRIIAARTETKLSSRALTPTVGAWPARHASQLTGVAGRRSHNQQAKKNRDVSIYGGS